MDGVDAAVAAGHGKNQLAGRRVVGQAAGIDAVGADEGGSPGVGVDAIEVAVGRVAVEHVVGGVVGQRGPVVDAVASDQGCGTRGEIEGVQVVVAASRSPVGNAGVGVVGQIAEVTV